MKDPGPGFSPNDSATIHRSAADEESPHRCNLELHVMEMAMAMAMAPGEV